MSRPARSAATLTRSFATSSSRAAGSAAPSEAVQVERRKTDRAVGVQHLDTLQPFQFNDIPWQGWQRLFKMKETLQLGEKTVDHARALAAQRKPFVPPTSPIRLTRHVNLSHPQSLETRSIELLIPVAKLPLKDEEAIHRCKIIAGPRWKPSRPGSSRPDRTPQGRHGWIKMVEERFPDRKMNRKLASDTLDKLVAAANDAKSPITKHSPIDTRHIDVKKQTGFTYAQMQAAEKRPTRGSLRYPSEWLSAEVKAKAFEGRQTVSR